MVRRDSLVVYCLHLQKKKKKKEKGKHQAHFHFIRSKRNDTFAKHTSLLLLILLLIQFTLKWF